MGRWSTAAGDTVGGVRFSTLTVKTKPRWILAEVTCFCWFRYSSSLYCTEREALQVPPWAPLEAYPGQPGDALTSLAAWLPSTAAPSLPCFTYCPLMLKAEEGEQKFAFRSSAAPRERDTPSSVRKGEGTLRNRVKSAAHYLNVWTAVAKRTAGAAAGGAGLGATGAGDRGHRQCCCSHAPWRPWAQQVGVSPGVELFRGCFGAVYWKDSLAWPGSWSSPNRDASLALQPRHGPLKSPQPGAGTDWFGPAAPNWQHVGAVSCLPPPPLHPSTPPEQGAAVGSGVMHGQKAHTH